MPIPWGVVVGWFYATTEELSSSHRPLTEKSRTLLSGPMTEKACLCVHTDTAPVLEQMLA